MPAGALTPVPSASAMARNHTTAGCAPSRQGTGTQEPGATAAPEEGALWAAQLRGRDDAPEHLPPPNILLPTLAWPRGASSVLVPAESTICFHAY